jgi:hypothetical protein
MLLRILVLIGLAAPNAVFLAWLATGFNNINAIFNNDLAKGFFLEMIAATFLLALFFKANPLGKVRVRWFVLLSLVGGVGLAIPLFYWLNKRSPQLRRTIRKTKREIVEAKDRQKRRLRAASGTITNRPTLILDSR